MHPNIESLLHHFKYKHLPEKLQKVSKPVGELARKMAYDESLDGPELTAGLRKLLEAKDCFVRAALPPFDPYAPDPEEVKRVKKAFGIES